MGRTIKLLGDPAILDELGVRQEVRGYQAWALLARIVLARGSLDRRTLAAELFPEAIDPLGSLRWCLASLRKALDCSECLCGDPVQAAFPSGTKVDAWELEESGFNIEAAGPLLGTIEPRCSPEFSTWLLVERERIVGVLEGRIRQETIRAISTGDYERAIRLAEVGVRYGPYNEGAHILLVKSLALAGRHEAALEHVEATQAVFLVELGQKPSLALRSAARRNIASPPGGISAEASVNSLLQAGLAALSAGAADAGIDCLRRAASDAEAINNPQILARASLELGTALVHAVRGYDDEGSVLLRQSAEQARQCGSATIASAALRELGYVEALAGRRVSAASYLTQAGQAAEDDESRAAVHSITGFNLIDWGRINEGLEQYDLALDHARAAGSRRREIWSLGLGAWGLIAADRLDEADAWLQDCLTLVDDQRWVAFRPWPVALLGETSLRKGAAPEAVRSTLEECFALSCQLADPCWEAAAARGLALTYAAEEEFSTAMEWLREARRRCTRETDSFAALQVEILATQAEISRKQGDATAADAIAREWVAMAARTHMDAHVTRAAAFISNVTQTEPRPALTYPPH